MTYGVSQFAYLVASALFIFALHWMNAPATARKGVFAGVAATSLAVVFTWTQPTVIHHWWIVLAIVAGFVVGVPLSRVPLTAVPLRTALSMRLAAPRRAWWVRQSITWDWPRAPST